MGTLSAIGGTHTATPSGITVVEQNSPLGATSGSGGAGTTYVVTVPWTAPASGTGNVSLRGVINAVNGGAADAGDKWNTGFSTATELTAITGSVFSVCVGSTITLSDAVPSGTWSSSAPTIANVNVSTGVVTGATVGTATITYTLGGSFVTRVVTVNPIPGTIGGPLTVCATQTVTLTNPVSGGTWSSGSPSVATIGSSSGIVTGASAGTAVITYAIGTCTTTSVVTVNPLSANTGTASVCVGSSTSLSNVNTGGTWSSSNTAVGTVNASGMPGVVSGLLAGTTNITYTTPLGCASVTTVTVNAMPSAIGGTLAVCQSATVTATNSLAGGTWTASVGTGSITVGATTGVITGNTAGTANLTYTVAGCSVTDVVTVNPLPPTITGTTTFCANSSTTLSNASAGGTWSSSATTVVSVGSLTGVVSGVGTAGGPALVSYTLPTGCRRTVFVSVNPISPVSGSLNICIPGTTTLTSAPAGGTWSSSNVTVSSIGSSSGIATGISLGTSMMTYTIASSGCRSTAVVTVNIISAISGGTSVCAGSTLSLFNTITGGTWSSTATSVGTINATSGVFTGLTAGTTTVSYTSPATCVASTVVTVNTPPSAVTASGGGTFCGNTTISATGGAGGTIYFQGTTSGGTSTATPSTSRVVTASGTYYFRSQSSAGCWGPEGSVTVTINPNPDPITGTPLVCAGSPTPLASATSGGTWSSANTVIATIGSTTGSLFGVSAGTVNISYTLSATGCFAVVVATVTPIPSAVTVSGGGTFCGSTTLTASGGSGGTIYYQGTTSGGTSTATASASQSVTTTGVYYFCSQSTGGCWGPQGSAAVTINPTPATITGVSEFCLGSITTLANATPGGTWSSGTTSIATVNSSGLVLGLAAGTTVITYTIPGGCFATRIVTVHPLPSVISGSTQVCVGSTVTLSSTPTGTWTSSNTTVATVGSSSGMITGINAGTTTISYAIGPIGCSLSTVVTVNPLPAAITGGSTAICVGGTTTLSSATSGGTWGVTGTVVSVGSTSGIVTGSSSGVAVVTYTLPTGCRITTTITVNPLPSTLTGSLSICEGSSTTFTSTPAGGTWASGTTSVATVGSSSGIATAVSSGNSIITYTIGTGCTRTAILTVNPLPATISGTAVTCVGTTTTLSSSTSGGTWSSSNTSVATVNSSTGVVTGVAIGTTTISYSLSTGCFRSTVVTVNAAPSAGTISGSASVCTGLTTSLTSTVSGGTWVSTNTAVATVGTSGVVTGVTAGTTTISYSVTGVCGTVVSTFTMSVTTSATAGSIGGTLNTCIGSTTTLTSTVTGGTWASSTPSVATIGSSSGVATGTSPGTSTITYTISSGCGVATTTAILTVNPIPVAIAGSLSVCVNATMTLSGAGGGTWSSANTSVADIGPSTGLLTGISAGTSRITYTLGTGCFTTAVATVVALPAAITGSTTLCAGTISAYTNSSGSGTWASSNTTVASVGSSTGSLTALSGGTTTLTFTLTSTGCANTATITVNPAPASITGNGPICLGASITLSSTTPGGTWNSSNISVAVVGSATGVVTGSGTGTASISYTLSTGCRRTATVTVVALPAVIGGTLSACIGNSSTLTNTTTGGTWSSSDVTIATVGSASGVVNGVAAGTATISYTSSSGCVRTAVFTVNPLPSAITGTSVFCVGESGTLTSSTSAGVWISGSTAVATVGAASGAITAVSAGTSMVTYSISATGCITTSVVTVNPLPSSVSGTLAACVGSTSALSSTPVGGTWASGTTSVGTIDASTGIVTGISAGTTTVTYTLSTGCTRIAVFTVNPLPTGITGTAAVCVGSGTTLSGAPTGGTWASSNTAVATVTSTGGVVTGVSAGTVTISYRLATGCGITTTVTVNPFPDTISGPTAVCVGSTITAASTSTGGTWSSSNTLVASVGSSSGVVTGVSAGTTVLTYTLPTGCFVTRAITVNPLPSAGTISGPSSVCVAATSTVTSTVSGGTWSTTSGKASISATGILTGVAAGLDTVKYTVSTVCGTATAIYPITVNPLPAAGTITGTALVCFGLTSPLSSSVPGGSWSTGTATASVSSSGVVTGNAIGTATISYTVTNSCGSASATIVVTVTAVADAGTLLGADSVCQADTIHLAPTVSGGSWSASNLSIATVSTTGIVTGVSSGTVVISYIVTNSCSADTATKTVFVKPAAACLTRTEQLTYSNGFKLYPNPAHDVVTVTSETAGTLHIFSLDGRLVQSVQISTGDHHISLQREMASGTYLCRFNGVDGSVSVVRFVYEP